MHHLEETELGYFVHLRRAWSIAFVLFIHGLFPSVWEYKASNMLKENNNESDTDGSSSPDHPTRVS